MKRLILFTFFIAAFAGIVKATISPANKDVIGEWKYEVPTAPYGYEKGVMSISEKEGKLVGEVKMADGYKVELKNVEFADGILKCGLYIDYDYINVSSKIEGKKMTGTVKTPQGDMNLTAEKIN